jgi:hypothetical protein
MNAPPLRERRSPDLARLAFGRGKRKIVVTTGRKYHGRYTLEPWAGSDDAVVGYCFVNGKGREYLRNYRMVRDHAVRTMREAGVRMMLLPYKKGEDPRKRVFAERFLKPMRVLHESDTHVFFVKAI